MFRRILIIFLIADICEICSVTENVFTSS